MAMNNADMAFSSAHFIGIGGAGMSGIALVLHQRGRRVTGSDLKESHYVRELEAAGISVRVGHDAATIDEVKPDVVVISTAIPESNPELVRARELGIPVWPRAKMLSALCEDATTVAVAGTHGKTTTSSMVATMLDRMGLDPAFLIGGVVEGYGTNGRDGRGGYFVAEADESDGSFLFLDPDVVVVTNVEEDHMDHYGTLERLEATFQEFMGLVGEAGTIVIMGDVAHYVELAQATGRHVVTYGFEAHNDYVCTSMVSKGISSSFVAKVPSGEAITVSVQANPGRHNVLNALASIAVADVLGLDVHAAAKALSEFKGARRRFTHVGDAAGITVVDDYGHHPTEIDATLGAAAELDYKRVVCVFQPHRYTRTQIMRDKFATAFNHADVLYVMDVFPASEMPIPGISGKTVSSAVLEKGSVSEVHYVPNRRRLLERLVKECKPGDLVITQGAGDVTLMGPALLAALNERTERDG
ncbi:MAG: UDP-N-acetylmuramate--L-alanine ligase [Atopobiaceae bacterium]|nr:UDP-N-acetylmuramate--L-alanine ligase [Atopobiaceae bacterium]